MLHFVRAAWGGTEVHPRSVISQRTSTRDIPGYVTLGHRFSTDSFAMKVIDKAGELNDEETMDAELSILKGLK